MPYVPLDSLTIPPDDAVIWRFMDIPRLVSLLTSNSLWFSRLDQLGDDWEGVQNSAGFADALIAQNDAMLVFANRLGVGDNIILDSYAEFRAKYQRKRNDYAASCWYCDPNESMLMWKVYARDHLAIRSTVGALKDSFNTDDPIHVGVVRYDSLPSNASEILRMYTKRPAFRGESELRAMYYAPLPAESDPTKVEILSPRGIELATKGGLSVTVSTHQLIHSIVSSPMLPVWAHDTLVQLVSRLDTSLSVQKSELSSPPPILPAPTGYQWIGSQIGRDPNSL